MRSIPVGGYGNVLPVRRMGMGRSKSVKKRLNITDNTAKHFSFKTSESRSESFTMTRLALVGDIHMSSGDFHRAVKYASGKLADEIIFLGDFGYVFSMPFLDFADQTLEDYGYDRIFFIDGNHEDFDFLESIPADYVIDEASLPLRRVTEKIIHIPRGTVMNFSGVNFLCVGGAVSVDKQYRLAGSQWWPQEALSHSDVLRVNESINDVHARGDNIEYVLAHDAPVLPHMMLDKDDPKNPWPYQQLLESEDHVATMHQIMLDSFAHTWYHGHYHEAYKTRYDVPGTKTSVNIIGLGYNDHDTRELVAIIDVENWDILEGRVGTSA